MPAGAARLLLFEHAIAGCLQGTTLFDRWCCDEGIILRAGQEGFHPTWYISRLEVNTNWQSVYPNASNVHVLLLYLQVVVCITD